MNSYSQAHYVKWKSRRPLNWLEEDYLAIKKAGCDEIDLDSPYWNNFDAAMRFFTQNPAESHHSLIKSMIVRAGDAPYRGKPVDFDPYSWGKEAWIHMFRDSNWDNVILSFAEAPKEIIEEFIETPEFRTRSYNELDILLESIRSRGDFWANLPLEWVKSLYGF